jgi:hypothetical protein
MRFRIKSFWMFSIHDICYLKDISASGSQKFLKLKEKMFRK